MFQNNCKLSVNLLSNNPKNTGIKPLKDITDVFNDGTGDSTQDWNEERIILPPLAKEGEILQFTSSMHPDLGRYGLDSIKLTTNQRCSPR